MIGIELVPVSSHPLVDERLGHRSSSFNGNDLVTGSMEEPNRGIRDLIGQDRWRKRSISGRTEVVVASGDPHVPSRMALAVEDESEAGSPSERPTGQHQAFRVAAKLVGPLPDEFQRGTECFLPAVVGAGTPVWDYDNESSRTSRVGKRLENMPLVGSASVSQQDDRKSGGIRTQAIYVQIVFRTIRNTAECLDVSIHVRSLPVRAAPSAEAPAMFRADPSG
jgi:hypothetical protein